jgi:hypothetical protein
MEIYNKVFKETLMETIDADRKVKHTKMANLIEESLKDKKKLLGVDPSNVESCYPSIIQSGGNFSLKYSAQSTKEPIHFGTIIAFIGLRYKNYCANTVNTLYKVTVYGGSLERPLFHRAVVPRPLYIIGRCPLSDVASYPHFLHEIMSFWKMKYGSFYFRRVFSRMESF